MELKDIIIDFEYAKRLKELGVNQESLFWYEEDPRLASHVSHLAGKHPDKISAFTSDELFKILPSLIKIKIEGLEENDYAWLFLQINKDSKKFIYIDYCNYIRNFGELEFHSIFDSSDSNDNNVTEDLKLSNALAKMVIWCLENKVGIN